MHHVLYDGLSIPLIFQDLAESYTHGYLHQRLPFHNIAHQICRDQSQATEFWKQKLCGYEAIVMSNISYPITTGMVAINRVSSANLSDIMQGCKMMDVTLQTAAILAFGKVLSCLLGRRDVVFGHVIAGRSLPIEGIENIIGPLFNTVPFRFRLGQSFQTNADVALQIQALTSDSLPHQHAPLQHIQNAWRRIHQQTDANLFDTLF